MSERKVTERDFRFPEFRDANVEDYEFRADGKLVRRDRWERAVQSIRFLVGINGREFEIPEVVDAVRKLTAGVEGWYVFSEDGPEHLPEDGLFVEVRLEDGSLLRNVYHVSAGGRWLWCGVQVSLNVVAWREQPAEVQNDSAQPD